MAGRELALSLVRVLLLILWWVGCLSAGDAMYDGARVHYESYGNGSSEAVVFIHGWSCDLTFWRGQAPFYEHHRSLLVDLPGHGQSDKPDVAYTQERFARAIEAVMRDAKVERAVLVGHSMGGPVALTFLRLFPDRTKGLVLVDAYLSASAPRSAAELAKLKAKVDAYAQTYRQPGYRKATTAMIDSMFSAKTTAAQREEIRTKMLSTPQPVMASAMEGMLLLEPLRPNEKYATLPVMAIVAARAPSANASFEARLRKVFPKLTFEAWQGSGHFLMIESPDRFNAALEKFVDHE